MILADAYHVILAFFFAVVGILLMGVILLQRGKGVGLAGAFGGTGGHTAFGAKTGDFLMWVTVAGAGVMLAFSIILNYVFVPSPPTVGAPAAAPMPGPVSPAPAMPPAPGGAPGTPITPAPAMPPAGQMPMPAGPAAPAPGPAPTPAPAPAPAESPAPAPGGGTPPAEESPAPGPVSGAWNAARPAVAAWLIFGEVA